MEGLSFDTCSYPRLKKIIVDFENDVLGSTLSKHEKAAVLRVSSLARFSAYRWIGHPRAQEYYNRGQLLELHKLKEINPSSIVATEQPIVNAKLFKRIGKWFAVTACDIGGAIADLSVASGAATSDYMSAIQDLH